MRGGQTGGHPQNVCVRQLSSLHHASHPPQRQGLACALSPSARSLPGPVSGSGGFRRNAARRIEYSRRQQKSRPREDGFDGSQRKGQSG